MGSGKPKLEALKEKGDSRELRSNRWKKVECQNLPRHMEPSGTSPGWGVWEQAILPSVPAPSSAFLLFEFITFTLRLLLAASDSLNISSWF